MAACADPHLLQTAGWATVKAASGWGVRRYVLREGPRVAGVAQVLLRALPLGLAMAYAPRGPLVLPGDLPEAMAALRRALRAERCTSLLADPEIREDALVLDRLAHGGVVRAPVYVQPRRTLLMDLRPEPAELLAGMRKKTRQYIHKAEREGVVTEETTDIERFLAVLRTVADRERFGIHDRAYFETLLSAFPGSASLLMARMGGQDAGGLLTIRIGDRTWELFGGWNGKFDEHRPFYLLKWRSLLRVRALGVTRYDMWGLDEDGALAGVENFKRGFGGEVVTWVGALESPVIRALYPLWQLVGRRRLARGAA